jgi:hypothetical protein
VEGLPSSSEYGGDNTSKTAQGVNAVKEWMLPPLLGKRTEASHGAFNIPSTTLPANPSAPPSVPF